MLFGTKKKWVGLQCLVKKKVLFIVQLWEISIKKHSGHFFGVEYGNFNLIEKDIPYLNDDNVLRKLNSPMVSLIWTKCICVVWWFLSLSIL